MMTPPKGVVRCRKDESKPIAAATYRATNLAQHQQHETDNEQDPADSGDDGWDRQQVADHDEDDT